jgi:hypothetical protein
MSVVVATLIGAVVRARRRSACCSSGSTAATRRRCSLIVYNVMGATITANYAAVSTRRRLRRRARDETGDRDAVAARRLANKDIADSNYGIAQAYGYRQSAFVTNDTSQAIAAGDILIPVNAQNYLARSAASDGKSGFVYRRAVVRDRDDAGGREQERVPALPLSSGEVPVAGAGQPQFCG